MRDAAPAAISDSCSSAGLFATASGVDIASAAIELAKVEQGVDGPSAVAADSRFTAFGEQRDDHRGRDLANAAPERLRHVDRAVSPLRERLTDQRERGGHAVTAVIPTHDRQEPRPAQVRRTRP